MFPNIICIGCDVFVICTLYKFLSAYLVTCKPILAGGNLCIGYILCVPMCAYVCLCHFNK